MLKYFSLLQFHRKGNKNSLNLDTSAEHLEAAIEKKQRDLDHEIIQLQYCLIKIFEHCSKELLQNEALCNYIDELAYESQRLLAHEHLWVRCNAAKLLALILASYDFDLVAHNLLAVGERKSTKLDFVYANPEEDIKSLVLDLCAQMVPGDTAQIIIDEMMKIFLFIANMLKDVPFSLKKQEDEEETEEQAKVKTKINLNWLMRNIRFLANKEVAKAPHCTTMVSKM